MLAKVMKFGLIGTLVATLLGGSAYILMRPKNVNAEYGGGVHGQAYTWEASGGRGRSQVGAWQKNGEDNGRSQGAGRGASREFRGDGDHPVETWLTMTGTVAAVEDDELTILTEDGELEVHLCPPWYWETEGIALDEGDEVVVSGFYEDGEFEVGRIENLTTGESVPLRDDSGRPMWAGRGRNGR